MMALMLSKNDKKVMEYETPELATWTQVGEGLINMYGERMILVTEKWVTI